MTVTAASGGNNIDNRTAENGSAPSYTPLGDIIIRETATDDIEEGQKNKKLILTAPSNWKFDVNSGNVSITLGDDIDKISLLVEDSSIEVKFTTDKKKKGKDSIDEITISGIQVQPVDGSIAPAAGKILRTSENPGNAVISGITEDLTDFGSLSVYSSENPPAAKGVKVKAATGGTNLVRSTAVNGHAPAYTTLGDITILETAFDDIKESQKNKKLILTAPSNWQFNPLSGNVKVTLGDDIKEISIKVKNSTIEVKFSTDKKKKGKDSIDEITISGIQVQPIDAEISPAAGDILRKSHDQGDAEIVGISQDVTSFGSLSTDPLSSMPVELVSFTSELIENTVQLGWSTATEVNNYGFEVQRSAEEDVWEVLGFVLGHGNSNSPKEYEFTDDLSTLPEYQQFSTFQYRLKQIDTDGQFEYYKLTTSIDLSTVTNIDDEMLPAKFELSQNYPNPFNPSTTIRYSIPGKAISETMPAANESMVNLKIFDLLGREIATLVNEKQNPGTYEVVFDASGLASGTYIYKLTLNNHSDVKKMLLLR